MFRLKRCSKCGEFKPIGEFHKSKNYLYGVMCICRKCNKERGKKYYEENRERIKKYREENRERISERGKEYSKKYYEENKERIKEKDKKYRENNKERISERMKKYRENNKERWKKYYEENKERINERGKKYREENRERISERMKEYSKKYSKSPALYDTYNEQISFCEETRRDPSNSELLQVRCTESNCRRWFNPTNRQARCRVNSLNGNSAGESRFYCSDECKQRCSIFKKIKYPSWYISDEDTSREVQPELRELVLERDEYECQRCGSDERLECHHIESIYYNPIESADLDNCITLCHDCHKEVHSEIGCRYIDLTRDNLCNTEEAEYI